MKKFTIISSIVFVILFVGLLGYVALSEDFVEPGKQIAAEESNEIGDKTERENSTTKAEESTEAMDSPVWGRSREELVSYLVDLDLIDVSTEQLLASSGLCSEAYKYSGVEIYWWDLDNLGKHTQEYGAYVQLRDEGYIDLYGMGVIIVPSLHGPFAILTTEYNGDVEALIQAFMEFE